MNLRFVFILLSLYGLTACSVIQRNPSSGYATYQDQGSALQTVDQFYKGRAQAKWAQAEEELGYTERGSRELTEQEAQEVKARIMLKRLEDSLQFSVERKQYYGYKPYFKNDFERIHFLRLPNREARERYAQSIGLHTADADFDQSTLSLIETGDLAKGMSKKAVAQSWGEPEFREVAGDELYGNERWHYKKLVSTEDGYKQERRIIYFEAGRVAGWETD
jgi:hypothetical protein